MRHKKLICFWLFSTLHSEQICQNWFQSCYSCLIDCFRNEMKKKRWNCKIKFYWISITFSQKGLHIYLYLYINPSKTLLLSLSLSFDRLQPRCNSIHLNSWSIETHKNVSWPQKDEACYIETIIGYWVEKWNSMVAV